MGACAVEATGSAPAVNGQYVDFETLSIKHGQPTVYEDPPGTPLQRFAPLASYVKTPVPPRCVDMHMAEASHRSGSSEELLAA